jgi:ATP-dependent exoDNAse (exonuclease V) beta subunit
MGGSIMDNDRFIAASAGTGKTHAISKAYVDLFEQALLAGEPIDVGNIAAITFTRKAAAEMKSRILGMIRAREASNPAWQQLRSTMAFAWINTIDSFAQRILSEVGIYAEVDPDMQIGSGSKASDILRRCMSRAFLENEKLLEPLLGLYTIDGISSVISMAVLEKRYAMMRSRPVNQTEAGLALHSDPAQAEKLVMASDAFKRLFNEVYRSFSEEMEEENRTDFTGVLITLKEILSSPKYSWVREKYSRQFRYIIVDEFQDTDSLQKEILDLLRSEGNYVIYVGDAKQSIFRFRGAEVEVIAQARSEVESRNGEVQHLEKNYRSHPDILKFCNAFYPLIFNSSEKPYSQTYEPVQPLSVEGETGWQPRVKILFDPEDEAEAAARYINSIVGKEFDFLKRDADGSKMVVARRPIKFRDIAILLRKMRPDTGREYMKALSGHGIPYYTIGESGFFEIPEIAGVLAALRVLSNPNDEMALTIALMSPVVGLDINEMATLRYRAKTSGNSIHEVLGNLQETDIAPGRRERLRKFHQVLDRYLPVRTLIRPSELAERLVEDLDYPAFLAAEDSTGRKTANLRKFIITAQRLDESGVSLPDLVRMLNKGGLDDEEQAAIQSEETDAVKIMTVHKAKGLEFPIVIVGDTSWSQMDSTEPLLFEKNEQGICFTLYCKDEAQSCETFLSRLMDDERDRDIEEEKRSLYVATTRASDMLILTFSSRKAKKAPWREMFLDNLLNLQEDDIVLASAFESLVEVVVTPKAEVAPKDVLQASTILETKYIGPVTSETFKEYVSPTAINDASMLDWEGHHDESEVDDDFDRERSQGKGLVAHRIMEAVENGCGLEDIRSTEDLRLARDLQSLGVKDADIQEVWKYLDRLKDHPIIKEIESALESRNEYPIARPFGKYILYGRPDKLIRTENGWKILDFKFSKSDIHSEANEFQMRFYLYLAGQIFSPLIGAELLNLMDGSTNHITLEEREIDTFENELTNKIGKYQKALSRSLCE